MIEKRKLEFKLLLAAAILAVCLGIFVSPIISAFITSILVCGILLILEPNYIIGGILMGLPIAIIKIVASGLLMH